MILFFQDYLINYKNMKTLEIILLDVKLQNIINEHNKANYHKLIICDHGKGPCIEISDLNKNILLDLKDKIINQLTKNRIAIETLSITVTIKDIDEEIIPIDINR